MNNKIITSTINTSKPEEFIDITSIIQKSISENNVISGIVTVFCPHTTAGITINENCDPDVVTDMLTTFDKVFPINGAYKHMEGNSHAHIKASLMGANSTIIIENGSLKLGTWQGIYFCEFDGPRNRQVYIKIIEG